MSKKISLKLTYKDDTYISDIANFSNDEETALIDLITEVVKGNAEYFTFEVDGNKTFFPADILAKSIITINYIV